MIEVVVATIVVLAILSIVGNFKVYLAQHQASITRHNTLSLNVDNKISDIYNEANWESLDNKAETVDTKYGDLNILYNYEGETEYSTNELNVTFELDGKEEIYSLERSVYYE